MGDEFAGVLKGRPDYFDDWVAWCSARIRGAVNAGLRVPHRHQLEHLFGDFMAERAGGG